MNLAQMIAVWTFAFANAGLWVYGPTDCGGTVGILVLCSLAIASGASVWVFFAAGKAVKDAWRSG